MTTVTKPRVTRGDLFQVAWRGNRALILVTTAVVVLSALLMVWTGLAAPVDRARLSYPGFLLMDQLISVDTLFGAAIGAFWGAPLVSREYELRTNLVAWGQDVSGPRWLLGQIAVLGVVAAGLAAVLGVSVGVALDGIRGPGGNSRRVFQSDVFESAPHVQVGYTLFAFALGVAASAVLRRTLPAMAVAVVGFTGFREVVARWGREHYLPPVRTFREWSPPGMRYETQVPPDALYVASGYADASGAPLDAPEACANIRQNDSCLHDNGVAGHYAEFQPADRAELFRWIETGIFVVLAAGLLVLAWWWVGRARRV